MDPRQTIEALEAQGLTQYRIAKRLREAGHRISQSTVNRIATGETANPSYRVACALTELLSQCTPPRRKRAGGFEASGKAV